jgi:hypothetical protein
MEDHPETIEVLAAYRKAYPALSPLMMSLPVLTLVRYALQSGMLLLARQPISPKDLADSLHLDETSVSHICLALTAHGILAQNSGFYYLEDRWIVLTDPILPFRLSDSIDYVFGQAQILDHLIEGDFWEVPPNIRLALARGVTMNPASPHSPNIIRILIETTSADLHRRFLTGARCFEMGCGIAGGLLSRLQAYPKVTAVGVDLAQDLLEEAQRQAYSLGVDDRVHFIHDDVRNVTERESFDFVFWSQFFFPLTTRADSLRIALQVLKPGGFLMAPVFEEPPTTLEDLRSELGRRFTLNRLMYGKWGIPAVGGEALQREIEDAGFIDAHLIQTPINRVVLARRK